MSNQHTQIRECIIIIQLMKQIIVEKVKFFVIIYGEVMTLISDKLGIEGFTEEELKYILNPYLCNVRSFEKRYEIDSR